MKQFFYSYPSTITITRQHSYAALLASRILVVVVVVVVMKKSPILSWDPVQVKSNQIPNQSVSLLRVLRLVYGEHNLIRGNHLHTKRYTLIFNTYEFVNFFILRNAKK